jgi:cytochrome b561
MLFTLFVGQGYMKVPPGASLAGWKPSAHASIGILILLLGLARLLWRLGNPPPALPQAVPRWQGFVSHAAHGALYALMVVIPVTGLLAVVPYGAERLNVERVTFLNLFSVDFMPDFGAWAGRCTPCCS